MAALRFAVGRCCGLGNGFGEVWGVQVKEAAWKEAQRCLWLHWKQGKVNVQAARAEVKGVAVLYGLETRDKKCEI